MDESPTSHKPQTTRESSSCLTVWLERWFYIWGVTVASRPLIFIITPILFTCIFGLCLVSNYSAEHRPDKLWIPTDSKVGRDLEWLRKNVPVPPRENVAILESSNVLTPEIMQTAFEIHKQVNIMSVKGNKTWSDVCFKLPVTRFRGAILDMRFKRELRNFSGIFDRTDNNYDLEIFNRKHYDTEQFCAIIGNLKSACWEINPCELWSYDSFRIESLSKPEVISVLSEVKDSPIFGRHVNYTKELGGMTSQNEAGYTVTAQSVRLKWYIAVNQSAIDAGLGVTDFSTGETVDETTWEWEKSWTELMQNISDSLPKEIKLYYATGRSWGDITEDLLFDDGLLLGLGFCVMFTYITVMIGGIRLVDQRPLLCISGLACVAVSVIVTFGIGATLGLVNGPVNKLLPFLLLGVGIDDVFVIIQSWNNLQWNLNSEDTIDIRPDQKTCQLNRSIGNSLRHAGLSITLTSVTDIVAFSVGTSITMPGLRHFCIYAGLGILSVFIFQMTFFLACFTIQKRQVSKCCASKIQQEGQETSVEKFMHQCIKTYSSKLLLTGFGKTFLILFSLICCGISIYGNTQLKQEFNPVWFLPEDSHLAQFLTQQDKLYPGAGSPGVIAFKHVNWSESLSTFMKLSQRLKDSNGFESIHIWSDDFNNYTAKIHKDFGETFDFQTLMGKFLYSPTGSHYRGLFQFSNEFACGHKMPHIDLVIVPFRLRKFEDTENESETIEALNEIMNETKSSMTSYDGKEAMVIIWSPSMVGLETNKIISGDFYKSAGLLLLCVLATTFFFIRNIRVCFLCSICVTLTVVNVGGMMYFWGLTIDVTTFIGLIVGVGLCVDYSAHIALAFMQSSGSKETRAQNSIILVGQAVLNGGISTFLSISLLAFSKSHAYQSFFKVFTLVIGFGLFNGLIILPILLSAFGFKNAKRETN